MNSFLTETQSRRCAQFREFARERIEPHAAAWDQAQALPAAILAELGAEGYFGANLPTDYGGRGWGAVSFGLLHEAIGRGDSALAGVLTVQAMVSSVILKWGTSEQKDRWLPPLASGQELGAIALTEPGGGSDLAAMTTSFRRDGPGGAIILNGEKKWISSGQLAGVFLVFGHLDRQPLACLVPRSSPGLTIEPIRDLLGFRAAGLAGLRFQDVAVPAENVIGKPGFALSHLAPVGLQWGRLSTACSALGLLRGCLAESSGRAAARRVGERSVGSFGMVQSLLAGMGADHEAATLLCWSACRAEDERRPDSFRRAFLAKYFSAQAAVRAAGNAVQIHGASGCHESSPVARYYRNAKIMEIIEGTTQVHEAILGRALVEEAAALRRRPRDD